MAWELIGNLKGPQGEKGEPGSDATVTVDEALSADSTNPVQNKVIKAALDEKAATSDIPDVSKCLELDDAGNLTQGDVAIKNISVLQDGYNGLALTTNGENGRNQLLLQTFQGDNYGQFHVETAPSSVNFYMATNGATLGLYCDASGSSVGTTENPAAKIFVKDITDTASGDGELAVNLSTMKKYVSESAPSITVDDNLNGTSTNPVQNKVVNDKFETLTNDFVDMLGTKADSDHTHSEYATTEALQTVTTDFSDALNTKLGKEDLVNVYKYKGTVANEAALPPSDNTTGDIYNVEDTGMNYAWDGSKWDALGSNTKYSNATTMSDGLMSSADKVKLDGISFASDADFKAYMGIS